MAYEYIMGIDPGVKHNAWVLLSLNKSKDIVYFHESGMLGTTQDELKEMVKLMTRAYRVAIEMPVFQGRRDINPGPILNTMRAAGACLGLALYNKTPDRVLEIPAIKWRAHLGFQHGKEWEPHGFKTIDSRIAHALPKCISKWPATSNVHQRDAAGVAYSALYAEYPTRYLFRHADLWGDTPDRVRDFL